MRKALYALLAVGSIATAAATVSSTPAQAWGGCGPWGHPTPWGCRPNHHRYWGGPAYVVAPGWGWHRHYWHHWRRW